MPGDGFRVCAEPNFGAIMKPRKKYQAASRVFVYELVEKL